MHINFGGSERYWCMFDFAVSPNSSGGAVEVELAADADVDTIKWFPYIQRGMMRGLEGVREDGCELVGIRIVVYKIHTHEIDTTEKGCERYGAMFVGFELRHRTVSIPA